MTPSARRAALAAGGLALALAAPAAPAHAASLTSFSTSFTDTCTVIGDSYRVPAVVTGRIPASVPRGSGFRISSVVLSATIPAELATRSYDLGARTARLTLSVVNARGVGVLPAVRDVVATDVPLDLPIRRGRPLPFVTPADPGLSARFTAGSTRGTARLQAGGVRATITLLRPDGSALVTDEPVTCAAPRPAVTVTTIRVT